jgi:hypothetical protein
MTKRKNYSIVQKLIYNNPRIVPSGISCSQNKLAFDSPFLTLTIRGWMKEENKLHSFVDSIEDDTGLQRKKTRLCEHSEAYECLYKLFLQKCSEKVPINGVILKAQAVQFNKLLGGDETFKVPDGWLWRWKVQHGICQFNIESESESGDSAAAAQFPETLYKATAYGGYTDEQLYNCDETALYYKLLPNKSLVLKKHPAKRV